MIHIGINTVNLNGKDFDVQAAVGESGENGRYSCDRGYREDKSRRL